MNFFGNQYVSKFKARIHRFNHRVRRFVHNVVVLTKRVILVMAVFSVLGWAMYAGSSFFPHTAYADKYTDISDEVLAAKIDILKDKVVDDISKCEDPFQNEGIITFDTNHVASLGQLQFQIKTVKFYEKSLYGKTVSDKEASIIALDAGQARSLAKDIMFTTKNMANDWMICAGRNNANQRIVLIKQLK